MPTYTVYLTTLESLVIEADSADEAEEIACSTVDREHPTEPGRVRRWRSDIVKCDVQEVTP